MTQDEIERLAEGLAELALNNSKKPNDKVVEAFGILLNHVVRLDARVSEIETRGVRYKGVWQPALQYAQGDMVTFDGSIFHCNDATRAKPGNGSTSWSLAVKRGADSAERRIRTAIRAPHDYRR